MKIFNSALALFLCGISFGVASQTIGISGLPSTLAVGDTITISAFGGVAPYSWSASHPPAVIQVTSLNDSDAQVIVIAPAANITIYVTDISNDSGSQMISTFYYKTRIGTTTFTDGDTAEVPVYYANQTPLFDLLSADIFLPYDTTAFQFIGFDKAGTLTSGMTIVSNQVYDTIKIGIAATIPQGLTDEALFLKLLFASKATVDSSISNLLHFTKFLVNETINGAFIDGMLTVDPIPNAVPTFVTVFPDTIFIMEGAPYSLPVEAADADSTPVYFSLSGEPAGMTIDTVTGLLEWTPSFTQAADYSPVIEAHDLFGGSVNQSVVFSVADSNRAPVFYLVPNDTTLIEGQTYLSAIGANDPDLDSVRYFIQSGQPPLLMLDSITGAISWSTDNSHQGVYPVEIVVTDNKAYGTATHSFTITVQNVNLDPVITTGIPDTVFVLENQNYSLDIDATDADNDPIKYSVIDAPVGMTIDSLSGVVNWTPGFSQAGVYNPTFKAVDTLGGFDSRYVVLIVVNVNRLPVFTSFLKDTIIAEGQLLTFNYTSTDADLDSLTFLLLTPISGMTVSAAGLLQWTPSYVQAGIETVVVRVSDGSDIVRDTALITIVNTNQTPVFTTFLSDTSIARYDTLRFNFTGNDPDNDSSTFILAVNPSGATLTTNGHFEWIPPANATGNYVFVVRYREQQDSTSYAQDSVNVRVYRFGDVSGNGSISSFDAGLILRDQVDAIQLTPIQIRVGNVSGGADTLAPLDASLILQYVVGLINTFPGGLGKYSKAEAVLSAFSFSIVPLPTAGDYDLIVSVNKPSQVYGMTMSLGFDTTRVTAKSMKQTVLSDSMSMAFFFPRGKANIALAGTKPMNTAGEIARFTFTLKENNTSNDAVLFTMKKFILNETNFAGEIGGITLDVKDRSLMPTVYSIEQNYPNPFNPATAINYQLPNDSRVTITVYNMLGQVVTTLISGEQSAGYHTVQWNGRDGNNILVSTGVYLYKIIAESEGKDAFINTKKMMLLK